MYVCGQLLSIFLRNNSIILAPEKQSYFPGRVLTDIFLQSDHLSHVTVQCPLLLKWASLQASSPFGGYLEKWTQERHTRRRCENGPTRWWVLKQLASLTQIGELSSRLNMGARPQQNPTARYNISIVCYLPLFSLPLYLHLTV